MGHSHKPSMKLAALIAIEILAFSALASSQRPNQNSQQYYQQQQQQQKQHQQPYYNQQSNNYNSINYNGNGNSNSNSYKHGHGYGVADSRYFKHGAQQNELNGGTCSEFLKINSLSQCCAHRDDDCYMIHYDTRCYCDVFCDRSKFPDNSDCCPDALATCLGAEPPSPPPQPPTRPPSNDCYKDGAVYRDGEVYKDNCNDWFAYIFILLYINELFEFSQSV
jgi:uncharacterized protein YxeA